MYKNITRLILLISIACSSQLVTAEKIKKTEAIIEVVVTYSSLPEFVIGDSLVWEISIGKKYFDEELCDIYPCAELVRLSGVGYDTYGVATSDGENSSFKFDNLFFGFHDLLPESIGDGFYHEGGNYMRFRIVNRDNIGKQQKHM